MHIKAINAYNTNNGHLVRHKQSQGNCCAYNTEFKGIKGLTIGAVTGGVIASFFTDMFLFYAALGAVFGDWLEEQNKNNDQNNNENQAMNRRNFRRYS